MEWILILVAVITIYLVSNYIRKQLSPKTNLIISLIGFIGLIVLYVARGFVQRFTNIQLIIFLLIAAGYCFYLYFRYKKIKRIHKDI